MSDLIQDEPRPMSDREVRQWCMFIHLGLFAGYAIPFGGLVVPVVLWQLKKDLSPEIDRHGRLVASAIVAFVFYTIAVYLLCMVIVGFLLLPVLAICAIAFPIIGGIKANDGHYWPYPLVPRLF